MAGLSALRVAAGTATLAAGGWALRALRETPAALGAAAADLHAVAARAEIMDVGRARQFGDRFFAAMVTRVRKIGETARGGPFLAGFAPEFGKHRCSREASVPEKKRDGAEREMAAKKKAGHGDV